MRKSVLITALICLFAMQFAIAQPIPDPAFTNWTSKTYLALNYQEPTGWSVNDSLTAPYNYVGWVFKDSVNPHSLPYDIKLQSKSVLGSTVPAIASSGILNLVSISPFAYKITGGFPVSAKPDSIKGWYKDSMAIAGDTSSIVAFFTKWDVTLNKRDTVAFGAFQIDSVHSTTTTGIWTKFSFAIYSDSTSPATPDTGVIVLYSGKGGTSGFAGTTLWVDDFTSNVGIGEIDPLNGNYEIFPNPTSGNLYIVNNNPFKKNASINLYDELGRIVKTSDLNDNTSVLNVKALPKGIYFYQIIGFNQKIVKTGKFVINN